MSKQQNWVQLRKELPAKRFWQRWNLDYTKRVLADDPTHPMAVALLSVWPAHIQQALRVRFNLAT